MPDDINLSADRPTGNMTDDMTSPYWAHTLTSPSSSIQSSSILAHTYNSRDPDRPTNPEPSHPVPMIRDLLAGDGQTTLTWQRKLATFYGSVSHTFTHIMTHIFEISQSESSQNPKSSSIHPSHVKLDLPHPTTRQRPLIDPFRIIGLIIIIFIYKMKNILVFILKWCFLFVPSFYFPFYFNLIIQIFLCYFMLREWMDPLHPTDRQLRSMEWVNPGFPSRGAHLKWQLDPWIMVWTDNHIVSPQFILNQSPVGQF